MRASHSFLPCAVGKACDLSLSPRHSRQKELPTSVLGSRTRWSTLMTITCSHDNIYIIRV